MKQRPSYWIIWICGFLIASCAWSIKGEKGESGVSVTQSDVDAISIRLKRPNFKSKIGSGSVVEVYASDAQPTQVVLGGVIHTNTRAIQLDTAVAGIGGIDVDTVSPEKLYYIYAVPNASSSTNEFALIASLQDPSIGPSTELPHSYLGAFLTDGSGQLIPFSSTAGTVYIYDNVPYSENDTDTIKSEILNIPAGAQSAYLSLKITDYKTDATSYISASADNLAASSSIAFLPKNENDVYNDTRGWLPLLYPQLIYIRAGTKVEGGTTKINPTRAYLLGWQEDPTLWD